MSCSHRAVISFNTAISSFDFACLGHSSFMARFVWAVQVYSHREGEWVRWFTNFSSEQNAQEAIQIFMRLAERSREYINWKVIKTIAWGKRAKAIKRNRKSQRKRRLAADAEGPASQMPNDD